MCDSGGVRAGLFGTKGTAIGVNAIAVIVVMAAGACSGDSAPRTPTDRPTASPQATSKEPLARSRWRPGQSAMAGSIPGTLVLDESGCVRLRSADRLVSVLWPDGWTATLDGQEVVITQPSGEHSLRTGETVDLGGGFISEEGYEAQRCASGVPWQVVGVAFE